MKTAAERKIYDQPQAPIGSTFSGDFLKGMIERKWVSLAHIELDGEIFQSPSALKSMIDSVGDRDIFAVLVNANSAEVYFAQIHTNSRVEIYVNEIHDGNGHNYRE